MAHLGLQSGGPRRNLREVSPPIVSMLCSTSFHIPVRDDVLEYTLWTQEKAAIFRSDPDPGTPRPVLYHCCICFLRDEFLLSVPVQCLSTHEVECILCGLAVFLLVLSHIKTMIHWWHKRIGSLGKFRKEPSNRKIIRNFIRCKITR